MKRLLLILTLLGASVASAADYPLVAVMGIGRGRYPGDYVTELRIGPTVYVSQDVCRKAKAEINTGYPARKDKQTIWVLVDSHPCQYRIQDEHPFLEHRNSPARKAD